MPTHEDILFGGSVLRRRWLDQRQIHQAVRRVERGERAGKRRALGEVLVDLGWIERRQAAEVERELNLVLATCPECASERYRDRGAAPGPCAVCGVGAAGQTEAAGSPGSSSGETDDWVGLNLPPYRFLERLGRGGMGTVYRVLNTAERRQSALKVLSSEAVQLNPSAVERFLSEGRLAAGLRHQNIVRVYGVGQLRGAYYIEMRLVAGPSVRQALRAVGRLSIAETVAVGRGVLKALVYAHSGGLVHRDIKPDNIMLSRRGSVRVTDFGIAKDLFAASAATQSGEVVGTPWYMAPEQVRGGPVDGRCDLYALGVTMFEMLAGEPGSLGVGPAVAMPMASSDVIPALQQARPDLPPRLARFIRKLMARDRRRRPSDAAAALARLERVAALERVEPADLLALVRRVLGHGPSAPDGDTTGPARSVAPPTPEPPWVRSVWIGLLAAALLAAIVAAYRVMQPPARDPLSHEATGYELLK